MRMQVQKWGNSLALRIPKSFAVESKIDEGATVDVTLHRGKIIVAPTVEQEFDLKSLLAKVTKRNLHSDISTGEPMGNEAW